MYLYMYVCMYVSIYLSIYLYVCVYTNILYISIYVLYIYRNYMALILHLIGLGNHTKTRRICDLFHMRFMHMRSADAIF